MVERVYVPSETCLLAESLLEQVSDRDLDPVLPVFFVIGV